MQRVKTGPLTPQDLAAARRVLREQAEVKGAKVRPAEKDELERGGAPTRSAPGRATGPGAAQALQHLEQVAARHGEVHDLDVRVLSRELSHKTARSVRQLYDAVQALKQEGRLEDPAKVTQLTPALVAKVSDPALPPRVRKQILKMAGLDLLRLAPDPVRDAALRDGIGTELVKRFGVRLGELPLNEKPLDVTLRDRNRRQELAITALLSDPGLTLACKTACIAQLGRVGGKDSLELLVPLAESKNASVRAAASAATQEIQKASKMSIVLCAFEARPYAGSGGLGNVMKELPRALAQMGHDVKVIMPRHASIDPATLKDTGLDGLVEHRGHGAEPFRIFTDHQDGVDHYFIDNDKYFSAGRNGLYGDAHGDYGDNHQRYDYFGAAIPQVIQKVCGENAPDVVQLNDAHTGSAAAYLKNIPVFESTKTVMAVHNLGGAYQGRYGGDRLQDMCFSDMNLFTPGGPAEFHGDVNLLKLGMVLSDGTVTVSRQYMNEVLTDEHGEGLQGVLRWLNAKGSLWGNLNGIDTEAWNPAADPHLVAPFSFEDLAGKAACKSDLQQTFGLPQKAETSVIGVVARLTEQKGWVDVIQSVRASMEAGRDVQYVMCGQGDEALTKELQALAKQYPDRVAFDPKFTAEKEHKIYGGSDFFLMPSRFEPCGLPQMYALRYLTVPIVRGVGGLEESIRAYDPKTGRGNGFKFHGDAIDGAVNAALDWYGGGAEHRMGLLRSCALSDFSWENSSAVEQVALYRDLQKRE